MEVTVCQCRKCGRYHVFEKIGTRDIHVCECGESKCGSSHINRL